MTDHNDKFDDLVDRLLESRPSLEPVDLDRIKLQTLGRGASYSFSSGAVHPPEATPRTPPRGFEVVATRRTSTFALVRYRSRAGRARVSTASLLGLSLSSVQPGVFLQSRARLHRR